MPRKSSFSVQSRIHISNTYLLPIFSYVSRFYLAPRAIIQEVERLTSSWVIPGRLFRHDHVTAPTNRAGFKEPLRDLLRHNLATILQGRDITAPPLANTDNKLLFINQFNISRQRARDKTGIIPPEDASYRTLFRYLSAEDQTNSNALTSTLTPSLGIQNAKLATTNIYNLIIIVFCPSLFLPTSGSTPSDWFITLFQRSTGSIPSIGHLPCATFVGKLEKRCPTYTQSVRCLALLPTALLMRVQTKTPSFVSTPLILVISSSVQPLRRTRTTYIGPSSPSLFGRPDALLSPPLTPRAFSLLFNPYSRNYLSQ